jgi:hypothetical protein
MSVVLRAVLHLRILVVLHLPWSTIFCLVPWGCVRFKLQWNSCWCLGVVVMRDAKFCNYWYTDFYLEISDLGHWPTAVPLNIFICTQIISYVWRGSALE